MTDIEGFERLFRAEYSRLVRALRVIDDDAPDAVQEAFSAAYARWGRVQRLDDPAGWVRRVAVNRLLNARRSRRRREGAIARLGAERGTSFETTVEIGADMQAAVRQLPGQQRVAVALFYGCDLTVAEIATAMTLSEGAVKYHLHAGRDGLRNQLTECPQ